ncbi:MAG: hypothetical protein ACE37I_19030 [Rubinisphaera brasiliensis]|uniref:hypothetical protein n=1 Tax=Rubinisphaera brasiliensis TaxID=119 RepID=UPI00391C0020
MAGRRKHGVCPLCGRECRLTFHHLIPRKLHRRPFFRKYFDRDSLNIGVSICRLCHNGIHDRYDEKTLGERFASLEELQSDEELQRHFRWVARQRIRD